MSTIDRSDGNIIFTPDTGKKIKVTKKITFADSTAFNLIEGSSAPLSPAEGDIYLDDGTNTATGQPSFRHFNGVIWQELGGEGVFADEIAQLLSESVHADTVMYVNGDTGSDSNDGLSAGAAKQTFAFLYPDSTDALPRYLNANVTVHAAGSIPAASTSYHTYIKDFCGPGKLLIQGGLTSVETLTINVFDNSETSVGGRVSFSDTTKSWTANAYQGMFLNITYGDLGGNHYPIAKNTSTVLTSPVHESVAGTPSATIYSLDAILVPVTVSSPSTSHDFGTSFFRIENNSCEIEIKFIDAREETVSGTHLLNTFNSPNVTLTNSLLKSIWTGKESNVSLSRAGIFTLDQEEEPGAGEFSSFTATQSVIVNKYSYSGLTGLYSSPVSQVKLNESYISGFSVGVSCDSLTDITNCQIDDATVGIEVSSDVSVTGNIKFSSCVTCLQLAGHLRSFDASLYETSATTQISIGQTDTETFSNFNSQNKISNASIGASVTYVDSNYVIIPSNEYDNSSTGLAALNYQDAIDETASATTYNSLTMYVDGTSGSDSNDGSSWAQAKKTLAFLYSEDSNAIPRELKADVTINAKGTVLSIDTSRHLRADGFYGVGRIKIIGDITELETGIIPTSYQNTTTAVDYRTHITASGESWTVNEHRGHFVEFTTGQTSGIYYPISSNTATKLEVHNIPSLAGTDRLRIVSFPKLRGAQVSDSGTLLEYADSGHYSFLFEACSVPIILQRLDMSEVHLTWPSGLCIGSTGIEKIPTQELSGTFIQNEYYGLTAAVSLIECNLPFSTFTSSNVIASRCLTSLESSSSINMTDGVEEIYFSGCIIDSADDSGDGVVIGHNSTVDFSGVRFIGQDVGIHAYETNGSARMWHGNYFEDCTTGIKLEHGTLNFRNSLFTSSYGYLRFKDCTTCLDITTSKLIVKNTGFATATQSCTNEVLIANDPSNVTKTFANIVSNERISNASTGMMVLYAGASSIDAAVEYTNTSSGLTAITYQEAIDELDTALDALTDGMVYKGVWDASAGSFPGGGSAQTGWFYYVSVTGTVDSVTFNEGDNIVATTDDASTSTYASNWSKHDQTDAVLSVAGYTGAITLAVDDLTDASTAGTQNVFLGTNAGPLGERNTGVGYGALDIVNATGTDNTALGNYALSAVTTGDFNIGIGPNTGRTITEGSSNIAIGKDAVYGGTTTSAFDNNIAIGTDSMGGTGAKSGSANVGIGQSALSALTSGLSNMAIGSTSLESLTEGDYNTAIGGFALSLVTSGDYNVGIGPSAGRSLVDSSNNMAFGSNALGIVNGGTTTSAFVYNIAIGLLSMGGAGAKSGTANIGIGPSALRTVTAGRNNVGIGYLTGNKIVDGSFNIVMGFTACSTGTTTSAFDDNIAMGRDSMDGNFAKSGNDNVGIGRGTLFSLTSGNYNITAGLNSGYLISSGTYNTTLGYQAGYSIAEGSNNVAIGKDSIYGGTTTSTFDNNIAIGTDSMGGTGAKSGYDNIGIGQATLSA